MDITPSLGAVNIEAQSPVELARFWSHLNGGEVEQYGEFAYLPAAEPGGITLFFQPATGDRPQRQPIHLDLTVPFGSRERVVADLVELGAVHQWDVLDEQPHVQWSTLADPEGNLFCIAEHPPSD
ncbi:VOC family protein [Dermacoccaceae bacterium W4C1]